MIESTRTTSPRLPFGMNDLDPNVQLVADEPKKVRCYVRDCNEVLRTPTRSNRGSVCPKHQIYCRYSSAGATYGYADATCNIIASADTFGKCVIGNPFKYESHRLGLERSEDSLSWNVFRSIQEAGCLHKLAAWITGESIGVEPFLYLWGICLTDDDFQPWDLLIDAREEFEHNLPVVRPLTEPDISLHLPGKYLIHIEAKFTSRNTFYRQGPRRDAGSLTLDELVGIYQFDGIQMLDVRKAREKDRLYYQLWRNTVFAEWMSRQDHGNTKGFHVNLVREGQDEKSAEKFRQLVMPDYTRRFQQISWEQIYALFEQEKGLARMRRYLETKTAGLRQAFKVPCSGN